MKSIYRLFAICILLLLLNPVTAQQSGTTYEVQPGDTLNAIARAYGLSLGQIVQLNNISNPDSIYVGQVLNVSFDGVTPQEDALLNPVNPNASIVDEVNAILNGTSTNSASAASNSTGSNSTGSTTVSTDVTSEALQAAAQEPQVFTDAVWPETYPSPISTMSFVPPEAWQGQSFGWNVELTEASFLKAMFLGQEYFFYPTPGDITKQAAILAVPVLQEPGIYPLELEMSSMSGTVTNLTLPMSVGGVDYGRENINLPPSSTSLLEPDTSRLESERVTDICARFEPIQRWTSAFRYPTDTPEFTSAFGINRAYNGGPFNSYHRGLDLRGREGTPVYAAENGVVRLAEALVIRGNAVILDHGVGLCSAYSHMSELTVSEGEEVTKGQLIGYAGATGLVTAAHVHWELRVMGIPVNPAQWAERVE